MEMLEKYQVLTVEEVTSLTDQGFCSSTFRSSYPLLKEISPNTTVEEQIRDAAGRNRYYSSTYTLLGGTFVFTSQLYGLGSSPTTRDNRTPCLLPSRANPRKILTRGTRLQQHEAKYLL